MSATIDFGIDLGTTNSCVARWEENGIRVFQNNDQMNVTPSAVYINRSGRKMIGMRAYSALRGDPENVAIEFKRWMGQKDRRNFVAANLSLSAEELSAEILKSLREDVRRITGTELTTAVITVPAAFGTLQCEATARAARLAGIVEAPLLQEPIAAAIGYGVRTEDANQHWLVFDLGGGTLDIAVVSTREGRLNVLEHIGNNLRGGKDIDRLIVDEVLLPAIERQFHIRGLRSGKKGSSLLQQLRWEAERAKIALSSETTVPVALFDIGVDDAGKLIELEVELTRSRLELLMQPMIDECVALARSALVSARISGKDLDRILLVGGPTQAPIMRAALAKELGAPVDFSVDPMTVVARGAALYATTLQRTGPAAVAVAGARIPLQLVYEPVSMELACMLAGRVNSTLGGLEVKVDAEGGFWTSGWLPLSGDSFETKLHLRQNQVTSFQVYLRDAQGQLLEIDSPEFKVRHGLVPSAPPLPHSISVEVIDTDGRTALDLVFAKGTPLPAKKTIKYRAAHALIPGKSDSDIYIKLWEGEFPHTPDANRPISNLELRNDGVKRRVPSGSEIEVTIQMDISRLFTVTVYVPILSQEFSNNVYVPEHGEEDYGQRAAQVKKEIEEYSGELQELFECGPAQASFRDLLQELRSNLMDLEYKSAFHNDHSDPDEDKRIVEQCRAIRGGILRLRYLKSKNSRSGYIGDFFHFVEPAVEDVELYGTSLEKQALSILRDELEKAVSEHEEKLVVQIIEELRKLHFRVLSQQFSYWKDRFKRLSEPRLLFVDTTESKRLIAKGQIALKDNDKEALEEVVRSLWGLLPPDQVDEEQAHGKVSGVTLGTVSS